MADKRDNIEDPNNFQSSAPYVSDRYCPITGKDIPTGEQLGLNNDGRNVQYSSMPNTNTQHQSKTHEIHHIYIERQQPQPEVIVVERPVIIIDDPYPVLTKTLAWILLFINIFFPGIGTMIVGCMDIKNPGYFLCWGLFQLLTAFLLIGWILAIQPLWH